MSPHSRGVTRTAIGAGRSPPPASTSLPPAVTHALRPPVYGTCSQNPRGGNGGNVRAAEGNPSEVREVAGGGQEMDPVSPRSWGWHCSDSRVPMGSGCPSPKGQVSPAWKTSPRCLPSSRGCPSPAEPGDEGREKEEDNDPKRVEISPKGGSRCGHPGPISMGGSGGVDGGSVWFPSASVPFESPRGCGGGKMSPAGWWGRGRERKIPIKGGHCLEPGMGLGGEGTRCSPLAPAAQVPE